MPVQHENRRGNDRRKFDLSSASSLEKERRWNKDPRHAVVEEEEIYDPDWEASELDRETYDHASPGD